MGKQTKLILSIIGLAAIVIPAILLIVTAGKAKREPNLSGGRRTINAKTIEDVVNKNPQKTLEFPSPSPSTASARPSRAPGGTGGSPSPNSP